VLHTYLADGVTRIGNEWVNREPLMINTAGTWALRPEAVTGIRNLFLASDYVQTNTDVASMEGANEAARRAVNGVIEASGASVPQCAVWDLDEPILFEPLRLIDRELFRRGRPHPFYKPELSLAS
jgi:uncharacterized protein with NAD-binding domain and iron-sulfur cluster